MKREIIFIDWNANIQKGVQLTVLILSHYCASFQSVHQLPKFSFLLRVICSLSDAYFLYGYIVHDVWFKFVLSQYYIFINDSKMYFYKRVSLVLLEYTQLTKKIYYRAYDKNKDRNVYPKLRLLKLNYMYG